MHELLMTYTDPTQSTNNIDSRVANVDLLAALEQAIKAGGIQLPSNYAEHWDRSSCPNPNDAVITNDNEDSYISEAPEVAKYLRACDKAGMWLSDCTPLKTGELWYP